MLPYHTLAFTIYGNLLVSGTNAVAAITASGGNSNIQVVF